MGTAQWMNGFNTALDVCVAIIAVVICVNFFIQKDIGAKKLNKLLTISAVCFSVSALADAGTWYFLKDANSWIFKLCLAIDYILIQMVAASLHQYIVKQFEEIFRAPRIFEYIGYMVAGLLSIVWMISFKVDIFFRFTATGYEHTDFYLLAWTPTLLVFVTDFVLLFLHFKELEVKEVNVFGTYIVLGILGSMLEYYLNVPALYVSFVMILLLLYINIDMRKSKTIETQKSKIEDQQIKIEDQQSKLEEERALLALSQIKPHFIYNCLNVIQELCTKDAEMAHDATSRFSSFLREYIDAMDKVEMIPLEDELFIVENYIYLEKLRFGDRLQIDMDIENGDFFVPPLSVEPLVENAIKYGILRKPEGGNVSIRSYDQLDEHIVEIIDNGVGIDENWKTSDDEKRGHVGMKNVESRLTKLCMGYMEVESEADKGTKVSIHIPKGRKKVTTL